MHSPCILVSHRCSSLQGDLQFIGLNSIVLGGSANTVVLSCSSGVPPMKDEEEEEDEAKRSLFSDDGADSSGSFFDLAPMDALANNSATASENGSEPAWYTDKARLLRRQSLERQQQQEAADRVLAEQIQTDLDRPVHHDHSTDEETTSFGKAVQLVQRLCAQQEARMVQFELEYGPDNVGRKIVLVDVDDMVYLAERSKWSPFGWDGLFL